MENQIICPYSSLPNNRVYTAIYFPKFSLVHALIKDVHDYLFSRLFQKVEPENILDLSKVMYLITKEHLMTIKNI